MTNDFYSSIARTMADRMKDPRCLIDAEALASHISIVSGADNENETTKTKKPRKKRAGGDESSNR